MKHVGQTDDGEHLVQLLEEEWATFKLLIAAVEGNTEWSTRAPGELGHYYFTTAKDINPTFLAILAFVQTKFRVNELGEMVDRLNELLGITEGGNND